MGYKKLFIWVEGEDDIRFFNKIIKPMFETNYDSVEIISYAGLKKKIVYNFFKGIKAINADYIYVTDINNTPCITVKKKKIQNKLKNINKDRIAVVVKEIESWYLAGLSNTEFKNLKMSIPNTTNNITKEQFNDLIFKKFDSRIDFMIEILKCFSIKIAKQKNKSFKYFIEKHNYKTH